MACSPTDSDAFFSTSGERSRLPGRCWVSRRLAWEHWLQRDVSRRLAGWLLHSFLTWFSFLFLTHRSARRSTLFLTFRFLADLQPVVQSWYLNLDFDI